jgi:hypothetical protein
MRTIVWDVDDVLNNLTEYWLARWRANHPLVVLDYGSIRKNPPHELLSISFETYLESLDEIRASVDAHDKLTPNPLILEWLIGQGHRFRHIALTARPPHTAGPAAAWVLNHFGAWIRSVAFVPTRKPPGWPDYDLRKVDYLQWLDVQGVLLDDSATNVAEVKSAGIPALLFPQPWNGSTETVPEVLAQLGRI